MPIVFLSKSSAPFPSINPLINWFQPLGGNILVKFTDYFHIPSANVLFIVCISHCLSKSSSKVDHSLCWYTPSSDFHDTTCSGFPPSSLILFFTLCQSLLLYPICQNGSAPDTVILSPHSTFCHLGNPIHIHGFDHHLYSNNFQILSPPQTSLTLHFMSSSSCPQTPQPKCIWNWTHYVTSSLKVSPLVDASNHLPTCSTSIPSSHLWQLLLLWRGEWFQ